MSNTFDRRYLVKTAVGVGAAAAAGQWLLPTAGERPKQRIKIGLRKRHEKSSIYKGLTWVTEKQMLGTKGLHAVAVEVDSDDEHIMDIAVRCIRAGMYVHLDKPGGESFSKFKNVLDVIHGEFEKPA